jgi:hypothetical protein
MFIPTWGENSVKTFAIVFSSYGESLQLIYVTVSYLYKRSHGSINICYVCSYCYFTNYKNNSLFCFLLDDSIVHLIVTHILTVCLFECSSQCGAL